MALSRVIKIILYVFIGLFVFNKAFAATIPDNHFYFHHQDFIKVKIDYIMPLVTTGQLYEESLAIDEDYTNSYGNGDYHINFRSARHGSKYVADVFNQYANEIAIRSDLYIPYMYPFADMKPEMLNFILACQLYFDDVLVGPIYIAQGHDAYFRNNWWISIPNNSKIVPTALHLQGKAIKITLGGKEYYIQTTPGFTVNMFMITKAI